MYAAGHPFAVFRMPGEEELRVAGADVGFLVSPWLGSYAEAVDVAAAPAGREADGPWQRSTGRDSYLESTSALIATLKRRGGKCVRMRGICSAGRVLDLNAAVAEVFDRFPAAFCHCYYTPATGLWVGATPELLLDCSGGRVRTMSLAGTRAAATPGGWDDKNVREQAFVTDFIRDVFRSLYLAPVISEPKTLRYGAIEHICTRIEAEVPRGYDPSALIDALSPTPAVAGLPRDTALAEIVAIEDTPRRCYAGWVAVRSAEGLKAFVNLRCAQLSAGGWCVYTGGGITADSDAASEWRETEAKAAPLLDILNKHSLPSYESGK